MLDWQLEKLTKELIKDLEDCLETGDLLPWQRPWKSGFPVNFVTRRPYRGVNMILLSRFDGCNEFITFNQLTELRKKDNNIKFKKGRREAYVVAYNWYENIEDSKTGEKVKVKCQYPKTFVHKVFPICDVEGLESKNVTFETDAIAECEKIMEGYNIDLRIVPGSGRAFYRPSQDFIQVPSVEQYQNPVEYHATNFHEAIHSTGHESRLNRLKKDSGFGSDPYAREELVAEIGANILLGYAGVKDDQAYQTHAHDAFLNSAAYISGWLEKIKENANFIVIAAQQAQKAADWIINDGQTSYEDQAA